MANIGDLSHLYGNDLAVTSTGDIALSVTWERTVERVIRRLLTAPVSLGSADYFWQPSYGVGLGERVGDAVDVRGVAATVRSQVLLEPSVARNPAPTITVDVMAGDSGAAIGIIYTDTSGDRQSFAFNLTPF